MDSPQGVRSHHSCTASLKENITDDEKLHLVLNEVRELKEKISILEEKAHKSGEKEKPFDAELKDNVDPSHHELSRDQKSKWLKWNSPKRG